MRALITPVGPWLAPYQPVQRYYLLDLRHLGADDLPYRNLLRVVARLEQSMTLVERVAEWPKQWLREGREQGRAQGVDQQRALLCRMAATRFNADTAAEFLARLGPAAPT